jgi:uncharacterized protein with PIN domain
MKCGRTLWATVPAAQLFAEERRCPRCGAALEDDRRLAVRRVIVRRQSKELPEGEERRGEDRRKDQRRKLT